MEVLKGQVTWMDMHGLLTVHLCRDGHRSGAPDCSSYGRSSRSGTADCCQATSNRPLLMGCSQGAGVGVVDHEIPVGSPGKAWLLRLVWPDSSSDARLLLPEAAAFLVGGA